MEDDQGSAAAAISSEPKNNKGADVKSDADTRHEKNEVPLHLQHLTSQEGQESDSDALIIDWPSEDLEKDTGKPEQTRADSDLTKMFGLDDSLSCSDITEDEYIPERVEETESSEEHDSPYKKHKGKKRHFNKKNVAPFQEVYIHQPKRKRRMEHPVAPEDPEASSSADNSGVKVMMLQKRKHGGRIYNKKFYCTYCLKPYSKMARHLVSRHKEKQEVARALAFPKNSKERRIQLNLLRNKGNRAHNNQVIKEGKGMVIPRQQPSASAKASDYLHCVNCEAYLKRRSLWRHMQRCHLNKRVEGLKPGKTKVQAICQYAQPVPDNVNERFWKLVLNMHMDEITTAVRQEKSILKFGEHLFNKHGHDVTKHEYVRQKMRETGRLVVQGQKNGKLKQMSDFFVPANFPHVIQAVQNVAGFNEETCLYKTPSLALKLGHNLKKIANIIECEAMISGNKDLINDVQMFKQICDTRWNECISSQALRNLSEAKWNAPQLLPFAEDVRKMHSYLNMQREDFKSKLEQEPTRKHWAELAKVTLCEIILFNRRREGEVSKMTLNAFTLRDTSATHPDVEHALSEVEKKLCRHFQRIEIKGKRGRKVPVLLTPEMLACLELLVKSRRTCEVPDENQFMFGRPQALSYFRGSDAIRQIARSCGASQPEALSSTKLRKHMATMSQVLNLKDNEMDSLADFLGHDIRVHRQYYRLPEGTLQLAKISKVLMALERGQLSQFQGRNLDEIDVDPQEKISVGSEASDTEAEDDPPGTDEAPLSPAPSSSSSARSRSTDRSSPSSGKSSEITTARSRSTDRSSPSSGKSSEITTARSRSTDRSSPSSGKSSEITTGKLVDKRPLATVDSETSPQAQDKQEAKRRKWSDEEIRAVEKTLIHCIKSYKVPGKTQCQQCIETSPTALQGRSWSAVKFYVKNRIDALKRGSLKKV